MNARWLMVVALGGLMGCPAEEDQRVDDILALTGDTTAGAQSYATRCETCHQADGTGGGAFPDLGAYLSSHSDTEFVNNMLEGPGTMPEFDTLEDQELADILAYSKASF